MALTPLRWVAAFIAGALLICLVASTPPRELPRRDPIAHQLETRLQTQDALVWALSHRLRSTQIADSIKAVAARRPVAPFRVFMDPAIPAALKGDLDALGQSALATIGPPTGNGIDVAFVFDTASKLRGTTLYRWSPVTDFVLPATKNDRCMVILRIPAIGSTASQTRMASQRTMYRSSEAPMALLSPCAYYGVFGLPSRSVDAWLRNGAWGFMGAGSWTVRAPPYIAYLRSWDINSGGIPILVRAFESSEPTLIRDLPLSGAACLRGEASTCRANLMASTRQNFRAALSGNLLMSGIPLERPSYYSSAAPAFGDRGSMLMASMVRLLGRDGFKRFWTSNDSVPAALQAVSGKPADTWLHDWMVEQYGPLQDGRAPSLWAIGSAMVLVGFALYFALRFNARRMYV